ncbi:MAG: HAD family hydrolase [Alistipes onderdonkii]
MIKGAIFDMDGTLVDNTPVHIRAFEIFCERYGIRDWKEKLGQAYGMGNDDIMKLIMPAEVIREKGLAALAEEKNPSTGRSTPRIVPMPELTDVLQRLRDAGIRCAVGSSGYRLIGFVLKMPYRALFRRQDQRRHTRAANPTEIYLTAAAAWG